MSDVTGHIETDVRERILVTAERLFRDGAVWHDPQTGTKHALPPAKRRRQAEAQQLRPAKQQAVLAPTAT